MKEYIKPELTIIEFDIEDTTNALTTSGTPTNDGITKDWGEFWN